MPYAYPAPVKGHLDDVNTGNFDLVDGIAYPASRGAGTVVYVTSKPIASPVLAGSPCPMTQARALTSIRNAGWVEVTLIRRESRSSTRGGRRSAARGARKRSEDARGSAGSISPAAGRRAR